MNISMVFDREKEDEFQKIFNKRIRDFSWEDRAKKKKSGMTSHQEWMLSLGIRWNFPEGSDGWIYYDPTGARWEVDLSFNQVRGKPILVPDTLRLKTLALGYLP